MVMVLPDIACRAIAIRSVMSGAVGRVGLRCRLMLIRVFPGWDSSRCCVCTKHGMLSYRIQILLRCASTAGIGSSCMPFNLVVILYDTKCSL